MSAISDALTALSGKIDAAIARDAADDKALADQIAALKAEVEAAGADPVVLAQISALATKIDSIHATPTT